jgi:hypothetical protein
MTTLIIRSAHHLFSTTSEVCLPLGSVIIQGRRIRINHLNLINGRFFSCEVSPDGEIHHAKMLIKKLSELKECFEIC